jgi:hypothetical protein
MSALPVEVGMTPNLLIALEADQLDWVWGLAGCTPGQGAKINAFTEDRIVLREPLVRVEGAQSSIDTKKDPVALILFAAPCSFRKLATGPPEIARNKTPRSLLLLPCTTCS